MNITCITKIQDHVIAEGNRLFADTPFANTWMIYHDALPQWWDSADLYVPSCAYFCVILYVPALRHVHKKYAQIHKNRLTLVSGLTP